MEEWLVRVSSVLCALSSGRPPASELSSKGEIYVPPSFNVMPGIEGWAGELDPLGAGGAIRREPVCDLYCS